MSARLKNFGLHVLVAAPMYIFGGLSGWLLVESTPDTFQRFGALAIALGVVLFGLTAKGLMSNSSLGKTQGKHSKPFFAKHADEFAVSEVFLVVLGTLQSGYGDLFHCWINGKGWTTC